MARARVSSEAVIKASKEIVEEAGGNIGYNDWKARLNERFETNVDPIIAQLNKRKTFLYWMDGYQENGLPNLRVVSQLPVQGE